MSISPEGWPTSNDPLRITAENGRLEEAVLHQLDQLARLGSIDQRWLSVGRTHIEQGFMAVNRAVARLPRQTPVKPSLDD
ncbi:DUF7681 family protein [Paracoccus contaminans]|uniref:Acb2/Tad1 hairpin domain-containing protein n=1 Tax=Paracoccus contaminans TaxID=1945662 RepID=A0A1W6CZ11_9RHOB|nr:hypothetical protein [Paracoccus contaminans]ARJ70086.1 hypothetical protein B0A89_11020 [Paracoccus contaminans]